MTNPQKNLKVTAKKRKKNNFCQSSGKQVHICLNEDKDRPACLYHEYIISTKKGYGEIIILISSIIYLVGKNRLLKKLLGEQHYKTGMRRETITIIQKSFEIEKITQIIKKILFGSMFRMQSQNGVFCFEYTLKVFR